MGSGSEPPLLEGASLVVIYQDNSMPESIIQIAAGAAETDSGNTAEATLDGFTIADVPSVTTTYIVADGQEEGNTGAFDDNDADVDFAGLYPMAVPDYSQGNLWDTQTVDVSDDVAPGDTSATIDVTGNADCLVWVGQVLDVSTGAVLGLGDSIAAGYGLGPSSGFGDNPGAYPAVLAKTLGVPVQNFAVEGSCASKAEDDCGDRTDVAGQLALVPQGFTPTVITLTVGADDINFSGCFKFILQKNDLGMTNPDDPCSKEKLNNHLSAFESNLAADLDAISAKYPGASILMMDYYNPFPPAPPARLAVHREQGRGLHPRVRQVQGEQPQSPSDLAALAVHRGLVPAPLQRIQGGRHQGAGTAFR